MNAAPLLKLIPDLLDLLEKGHKINRHNPAWGHKWELDYQGQVKKLAGEIVAQLNRNKENWSFLGDIRQIQDACLVLGRTPLDGNAFNTVEIAALMIKNTIKLPAGDVQLATIAEENGRWIIKWKGEQRAVTEQHGKIMMIAAESPVPLSWEKVRKAWIGRAPSTKTLSRYGRRLRKSLGDWAVLFESDRCGCSWHPDGSGRPHATKIAKAPKSQLSNEVKEIAARAKAAEAAGDYTMAGALYREAAKAAPTQSESRQYLHIRTQMFKLLHMTEPE